MTPMRLAPFVLAATLFAQQQQLEPGAILERARQTALNYSRNLPNFLCTEEIARYDDVLSTGKWTGVDRLTIEVRFSGQVEDYKLTARNGHATTASMDEVSGAFTRGEFASSLLLIFQESSHAEFEFQKWQTRRKRHLAVFQYHVRAPNSRYTLRSGTQTAVVAYHGVVEILPDTGEVFRWTVESDPPEGFPMTQSSLQMEYDYRTVDSAEYLVPVRSEMESVQRSGIPREKLDKLPSRLRAMYSRPERRRNVIEYKNYRRFSTESTVTFK